MQFSNSGNAKSEINVTPLVDVCLVLLIIFMVIIPLLHTGRDVRIPVADNPDKKPYNETQVTISIEKKGEIYIGQDPILDSQLETRLADIRLKFRDKKIMIQADKDLNYGFVKDVMKKCNNTGFNNVGLIVEKSNKSDE